LFYFLGGFFFVENREEGSNGDREMTSAFRLAGFQTFDVHMSDLRNGAVPSNNYFSKKIQTDWSMFCEFAGNVDLGTFRGVVFVGGFSYADVMDSAKV
jgi:phosphoribosylformylglycinamidine synthase